MLFVEEGFFVANNSFLIFFISAIDVLDNFLLDFGRLHVFVNWPDHLHRIKRYLDRITASFLLTLQDSPEGTFSKLPGHLVPLHDLSRLEFVVVVAAGGLGLIRGRGPRVRSEGVAALYRAQFLLFAE